MGTPQLFVLLLLSNIVTYRHESGIKPNPGFYRHVFKQPINWWWNQDIWSICWNASKQTKTMLEYCTFKIDDDENDLKLLLFQSTASSPTFFIKMYRDFGMRSWVIVSFQVWSGMHKSVLFRSQRKPSWKSENVVTTIYKSIHNINYKLLFS